MPRLFMRCLANRAEKPRYGVKATWRWIDLESPRACTPRDITARALEYARYEKQARPSPRGLFAGAVVDPARAAGYRPMLANALRRASSLGLVGVKMVVGRHAFPCSRAGRSDPSDELSFVEAMNVRQLRGRAYQVAGSVKPTRIPAL